MNTKTFGRRNAPAPRLVRRESVTEPVTQPQAVATAPAVAAAEPRSVNVTVDDELRAWKQERLQGLPSRIPWRQIYLMASLSFGIGSFVLPDSVNDRADYLLWALSAAAFVAWLNGRKKKPA